ncbi:MAG: PIG-L family deacetylase, partial [Bryobacteraceae bacterium]
MKNLRLSLVLIVCLAGVSHAATSSRAEAMPGLDDRYKADILLIVAHPDDETAVTGYLARALFEQHKRVAVVFGTPGNSGGDATSYAQADALGAERQIEARRALASFGVMNVWFLGGTDTPGQDVLRSLETWNHGAALWQTIRLVRLTRPSVILTWLPHYVAGENHGDHQASSVLATEAFDMAGDPTVFPEQVAAPPDRENIGNLTEGLQPWQPEKLYFFSDAMHSDFQEGKGPQYSNEDVSPSKHQPYYKLVAEEMAFHLTQSDTGQFAKKAIANNDYKFFREPVRFILGKSLVPGSVTGDILQGVVPGPIPYVHPRGYVPHVQVGASIELGGPFAFYREFWDAHNLDSLKTLLGPEVALDAGTVLHIPVLIHSDRDQDVTLQLILPEGWRKLGGFDTYPLQAGGTYPVEITIQTGGQSAKG